MDDVQLLREYARTGSQQAFAEIVKRHMRMVHATCLREVHDFDLAEDAAQIVFLTLARKARTVLNYRSLAGWLFLAARLEGRNTLRREVRRRRAEERHAPLATPQMDGHAEWFRREPVLNDALSALNNTDREAVLLRYFEGHTAREIADALGVSETAAERRLSRAVLKMREHLAAYGVATTAVLIALLEEDAARAAPDRTIAATLQRHAAAHGSAGAAAHAGAAVVKGIWARRATGIGATALLVVVAISWSRHGNTTIASAVNVAPAVMLAEKPLPAPSNVDVGAPLQFHTAAMRPPIASPHAVIRNGVLTLTVAKSAFASASIYSPQPFEGNVPGSPAFVEHPASLVAVRDVRPPATKPAGQVALSEKPIWTGDISKRPAIFMVEETFRGTVLKDEAGRTLWQSVLMPSWIQPPPNGMTGAGEKLEAAAISQARSDSEQRLKALKDQYSGSRDKAAEYALKRDAIIQETKTRTNDAIERARSAIFAYQEGDLLMRVSISIDHGTVEIRTPDEQLRAVTTADIATLRYDTLRGGTLKPITIEPATLRPRLEVIGPILPEFAPNIDNGEVHLIYRTHRGAFVVREVVSVRNGAVTRSFTDIFGRPAVGHFKSDAPGTTVSPLKRLLPSSLLQ